MLEAAGVSGNDVAERISTEARRLGLDEGLMRRFVNVDLSGGEKKRAEIVQMALLRPDSRSSTKLTLVSMSTP
jgi:Fe-S cluster assembly ATP-binding protein